jgi:hypothetical protein
VQAEVFVLWLNGDHVEISGPCGTDPWYIESGEGEDPMEVVNRLASKALGPPLLVHSTSWRRDRGAVILSFVVVVDATQVEGLVTSPVLRAELARGTATAAAVGIAHAQVLEHALRHLSWLAVDDVHVRDTLSQSWRHVLSGYVPEPFRHLG